VGWDVVGAWEMAFAEAPQPDGIGANPSSVVLDAAHGKIRSSFGTEM
jgi:hypothetical protein